MLPFASLILWLSLSVAAGALAHKFGRSALRWSLISVLISPLLAMGVLVLLHRASVASAQAIVEENPWAVTAPRHGAYATAPREPAAPSRPATAQMPAPEQRPAPQQDAPRQAAKRSVSPKLVYRLTAAAALLLTPAFWFSGSLYTLNATAAQTPRHSSPVESDALSWSSPSSPYLYPGALEASKTEPAPPVPLPTPTPAPTVEAGIVSTMANLRAGPGLEYAVTGLAEQGATLALAAQSEDGEWLLLANGDWIAAFLVTRVGGVSLDNTLSMVSLGELPSAAAPAEVDMASASRATVNAFEANLRSGPGADFGIAGTVAYGQSLELTGVTRDGEWYQLVDGRWIYAELVDNAPQALEVIVIATT